jgi:protein TonB
VISHFSTQVPIAPKTLLPTKLSIVELDNEEVTPVDEVIDIVIPPLVPKKPYVAPVYSKAAQVHGVTDLPNALPFALSVDVITVSINPKLTQPVLSLVPIYQEQPKYSTKAIRDRESGTVKLAYMIVPEGNVSTITTVESTANRELNFAAKKALSRWRYRAGEYSKEGYEIIFDFTLEN